MEEDQKRRNRSKSQRAPENGMDEKREHKKKRNDKNKAEPLPVLQNYFFSRTRKSTVRNQ